MAGKVIIIGATSGIGRALAVMYASRGFQVGVSGRRAELLESLQKEFPANIHIECFDVTGTLNILHLQNLIEKTGGLDILVYNSGIGNISKELDWFTEKETTDVNVNGFIEIVCYAFNYFKNQGHGQIAAISSVAATRGNGVAPSYSASKAFMSTYMEGLYIKAFQMDLDIAITDIQPGFVNTKVSRGNKRFWMATTDKAVEQIYRAIEMKKRKAYVTKRWWLVALLIKMLPMKIYKRLVRN